MNYFFKNQKSKHLGACFEINNQKKGATHLKPHGDKDRRLNKLDPHFEDLTLEQIEALKKYQNDFWLQLLIQAEVCFELELYDDCIARHEAYLTRFPDNSSSHKRLGQIYFNLDRMDKAVFHAYRASELKPDDLSSTVFVTYILLICNLEDKATEILTNFFRKNPITKREAIGHAYMNDLPFEFVRKCWAVSKKPHIKVV